ncbi:MAG TPA: hypothetical protein VKE93_02035 [Candidatus Angelobacter sp.]|nr:hypothetical protein [Candidatus Angelobacter sp.]
MRIWYLLNARHPHRTVRSFTYKKLVRLPSAYGAGLPVAAATPRGPAIL